MRLITRLDLDGVVCAAMISTVERITQADFANPKDIEERMVDIDVGDAVAHLPLHPDARLWFHHHGAEGIHPEVLKKVRGNYKKSTSAARLVYEYYNAPELKRFEKLVSEVDRVQTANLTKDDIVSPKEWILLSYTLDPRFTIEEGYGTYLLNALKEGRTIGEILALPPVAKRVDRYLSDETKFQAEVAKYTKLDGNVIVTDFRNYQGNVPHGNRFFVFTLFPQGSVHVRIETVDTMRDKVSVSKSIINRTCTKDIGNLMAQFGGGGLEGAGTCMLNRRTSDTRMSEIIAALKG